MFSTRIDPQVLKQAKKLSIDLERTLADLVEEAVQNVLKKYKKKASKK